MNDEDDIKRGEKGKGKRKLTLYKKGKEKEVWLNRCTEDDDMVSGCNLQGNTLQLQETLDGYFGFLRQNNKVS